MKYGKLILGLLAIGVISFVSRSCKSEDPIVEYCYECSAYDRGGVKPSITEDTCGLKLLSPSLQSNFKEDFISRYDTATFEVSCRATAEEKK